MSQSKALWEILVPCEMNGKPVRTRHHREWDKVVRKVAGGLTILKPAKGQWVDPGGAGLFVERMIPVRINCTEKEIRKIIKHTLQHYNQIAVMAYQVSEKVIIEFNHDNRLRQSQGQNPAVYQESRPNPSNGN